MGLLASSQCTCIAASVTKGQMGDVVHTGCVILLHFLYTTRVAGNWVQGVFISVYLSHRIIKCCAIRYMYVCVEISATTNVLGLPSWWCIQLHANRASAHSDSTRQFDAIMHKWVVFVDKGEYMSKSWFAVHSIRNQWLIDIFIVRLSVHITINNQYLSFNFDSHHTHIHTRCVRGSCHSTVVSGIPTVMFGAVLQLTVVTTTMFWNSWKTCQPSFYNICPSATFFAQVTFAQMVFAHVTFAQVTFAHMLLPMWHLPICVITVLHEYILSKLICHIYDYLVVITQLSSKPLIHFRY